MDAVTLMQISVCLAGNSALQWSVFTQSLDWASRFQVPLKIVIAPDQIMASLKRVDVWSAACAERGVVMETNIGRGEIQSDLKHHLQPHSLCVLDYTQAHLLRQDRLPESMACYLVCAPNRVQTLSMLVLCHQERPCLGYLRTVAKFCQALETRPVILSAARTEQAAQIMQRYIQSVLESLELDADFDWIAGSDLRDCVGHAVSWLDCTHLVVERQAAGSTASDEDRDVFDLVRGFSDSLNILVLPEGVAFDVASRMPQGSPH
jgi:hypothetical protein